MVTLKDIAKECKVSFSTVSKALKGSKEISEETILMIQKKAAEMGYHPNLAARTLRTNRTNNIGVIFEDKTHAGFQHQYFAKLISGLQECAQEKGYDITFTSQKASTSYDYYNHVKGRNFDGVAILSADFNQPGITTLVQSEIPTVTLDYFYDNNHTAIMSDNKKGMTELTEYVLSMGHKKIAIIHGEDTLVTRERIEIFKEVCKKHGIDIPPEYIAQGLYHDPITSSEATSIFLDLPDPPTCIFYPDDYSSLGGIRIINSHKLKLGKDISIVGYDGIMLTSLMIPPLTTYEQNGFEIGKAMGQALIRNIEEGNSFKSQRLTISGRLLKGGSVAKI
ncbi:MAG: LacI family transcriptional regulator [Treponema sp.]|nr:LacI family transcriptional regulator [Treponema sp.]